ncbi:hypothetical protein BIFADO_02460 [Bifidobacterium adolescentis L2-32]|uniref:Uncharacterized protein n=1 Tax=Bifidobacterium adolescentis L2-32 TaxID=411481 RepID=A7A9B2_BIFAD|nr:hypothetical protein BIFADO_02460 [Bifidobacterium adolescentis L2-32]
MLISAKNRGRACGGYRKVRSVQCQELRSPQRPANTWGLSMLWNQSLSIEFAIPRNSVTTACAGMPRVARLPRFSARPAWIRRSSATSASSVASPAGRRRMPRRPLRSRRLRSSRTQVLRFV